MAWTTAALTDTTSFTAPIIIYSVILVMNCVIVVWGIYRQITFWAKRHAIQSGAVESRLHTLVAMGLPEAIAAPLARGEKINAIKAYREAYGFGLKQAKDAIEAWEHALRAVEQAGPPTQ